MRPYVLLRRHTQRCHLAPCNCTATRTRLSGHVLPRLPLVQLCGCWQHVSHWTLAGLAACSRLTSFTWAGCGLAAGVPLGNLTAVLSRLTNLRRLEFDVQGTNMGHEHSQADWAAWAAAVAALPALDDVHLAGVPLSKEPAEWLASAPHLTSLALQWCGLREDAAMGMCGILCAATGLRRLDLRDSDGVSNACVAYMQQHLTQLTRLLCRPPVAWPAHAPGFVRLDDGAAAAAAAGVLGVSIIAPTVVAMHAVNVRTCDKRLGCATGRNDPRHHSVHACACSRQLSRCCHRRRHRQQRRCSGRLPHIARHWHTSTERRPRRGAALSWRPCPAAAPAPARLPCWCPRCSR